MMLAPLTRRLALMAALAVPAMASSFALPAAAETTANSETVKYFYESYNQGNPDLLDKVLAENWESIPLTGQEIGRDAHKPSVIGATKIFGDLQITNEDIIEAGNKVIVRSMIEGVHAGEFAGIPATNRPVNFMAIDIHEFNDEGLIAKTWHVEAFLPMLFQIGVLGD